MRVFAVRAQRRHAGAALAANHPIVYHLPDDRMQLEREMGRMRDPVFIIKPRASSRGRGIKLITSISQVPRSNKMLVQQYIHNPLLVDGYKCDIRVYVVVTSWEPLRVYIHEDGLVRFATQKYKAGAKYYKRKHAHITNYSTNKGTKNFVESASESQGSKWSLSAFRRWLREVRQVDDEAVWADMRDQCVRTILACEGRSYQMYKEAQAEGQCYEIWGFDLLLTEDLTPWVIEVNTSPSLSGSGTLDARIKTSLVMDTLNIVRSPLPSFLWRLRCLFAVADRGLGLVSRRLGSCRWTARRTKPLSASSPRPNSSRASAPAPAAPPPPSAPPTPPSSTPPCRPPPATLDGARLRRLRRLGCGVRRRSRWCRRCMRRRRPC